MPIYEYHCPSCGRHHEIMQKITEEPLAVCPACGKRMKKLISNTSFVLKGSGWYATDYASDKKKGGKETAKDKAAKTETKAETKAETTTETKKAAASS